MKPCTPAQAALSVAVIAVVGLATSTFAEIPGILESALGNRAEPVWVSEEYLKADGDIAWGVFEQASQEILIGRAHQNRERRFEKAAKSGSSFDDVPDCSFWFSNNDGNFRPGKSLSDLSSQATHIIAGVLTDREQGFLYGEPGTVFEIQPEQVFKSPQGYDETASFLVFIEIAKIELEGGFLCPNLLRRGPMPRVKAEVVLFLRSGSFNTESQIIIPPKNGTFYQGADGTFSTPSGFEPGWPEGYEIDFLVTKLEGLGAGESE